ncbi:hypothetical protein [Tautonia plasticadhaerens]|nr:hypothetical protein [Tautonia plasticadhaerens]
MIDPTDPASWHTFDEALAAARKRSDLAGVGFAFAESDPFAGIDLDDCRDATTGGLEPWAQSIVDEINSYTEVSPSGTGVKLFVRGGLPGVKGKRKGNIEVYCRDRYFTVTGHHLPDTPTTIEARQEALVVGH